MKISEHLDLAEITRSETAKRKGIKNDPSPEHIENFKKLAANVFEPIRKHFGFPIHITSGYRSKALNTAIGGSPSSQHCKGEAIDIDMDRSANGITNKMVFDYIKSNIKFDQMIWEFGSDLNPDWVHVSYAANGKQRGQILKAIKSNGVTKYIPFK
jgi:hypothetical protein